MDYELLTPRFDIDGAISASDIKVKEADDPLDTIYGIPAVSSDYKYGLIIESDGNAWPLCSKDGETWTIAIAYAGDNGLEGGIDVANRVQALRSESIVGKSAY